MKTLYEKYYWTAYHRIFYLIEDEDITKDIVQDLFIKLDRKNIVLTGAGYSYIKVCAYNQAVDYIRGGYYKRKVKDYDIDLAPSSSLGVEESQIHDESLQEIRDVLHTLSKKQQDLLIMAYLKGKSYKEIADKYGTTEDSIRSSLYRTRELFKSKYNKYISRI